LRSEYVYYTLNQYLLTYSPGGATSVTNCYPRFEAESV